MDRRSLIKFGLASGASVFAGRFSFAAPAAGQNRLVFIIMRGALDEDAVEVYRHYHVPASNTAAGLMILANRSAS